MGKENGNFRAIGCKVFRNPMLQIYEAIVECFIFSMKYFASTSQHISGSLRCLDAEIYSDSLMNMIRVWN